MPGGGIGSEYAALNLRYAAILRICKSSESVTVHWPQSAGQKISQQPRLQQPNFI